MVQVQQEERVECFGNDFVGAIIWLVQVVELVQERLGVGHSDWWGVEGSSLAEAVCHSSDGD